MLARGFGLGLTMMPAMTAAYSRLRSADIAHATPQLNVLQRVGGSIGTSILTVVLSHRLTDVGASTPDAIAGAFGHAYLWAVAVTAFAVLPAIYLAVVERRSRERRAGVQAAVDGEILPDREPLAA
jgi:hypothetical protein